MRNAHLTPEMLSPEEAAVVIGRCRTTVFALMKSGELKSVLVSPRKRQIPREACLEYKAKLIAAARSATPPQPS